MINVKLSCYQREQSRLLGIVSKSKQESEDLQS